MRDFYEVEAALETRGAAVGRRVATCAEFVDAVAAMRRPGAARVLDVGAGPGTDAATFVEAGLAYVGMDLAVGNARLAARSGVAVVPGSLFDLPFADRSFDALWTMSTLMHVPEAELPLALAEIRRVLRPGALIGVGQWGGPLGDIFGDTAISGHRRLFSLRAADVNRSLLESLGTCRRFDVWDVGPEQWEYHFAVLELA